MAVYHDVTEGTWEETRKQADDVRRRAVTQFLRLYRQQCCRAPDPPLWGDELEYLLVELDTQHRKARLRLDSLAVLDRLRMLGKNHVTTMNGEHRTEHPGMWSPEGVPCMVESIPDMPFGPELDHVTRLETNMAARRRALQGVLDTGVVGLMLAGFPRFGCADFTVPSKPVLAVPGPRQSAFVHPSFQDTAHPRIKELSRNLHERYEDAKAVNLPVYQDERTAELYTEGLAGRGDGGQPHSLPGHVLLDSGLFAMSLASIHVTQQAANEEEARRLFDLLAVLAPLMMALSAACPVHRGHLVDTDGRWVVLTQLLDDRCPEERDKGSPTYRSRRRFDSVTRFLSPQHQACNDVTSNVNQEAYATLRKGGVDAILSSYMAEVLSHDPLYLQHFLPEASEEDSYPEFQLFLCTTWQAVRLKPPQGELGWRVEFRPMDVQLTEAENAALDSFVVLVSRALLHFRLSLAIPVSKLDENMVQAVKRNAVTQELFHFSCRPLTEAGQENACHGNKKAMEQFSTELMSVNDVINGNAEFEGLVPIIGRYLAEQTLDDVTRESISRHLSLISRRASGKTPTLACWIRDFVTSHPDYRKDSLVSDSITFDLLVHCSNIAAGKARDPAFFPRKRNEREGESEIF